MLTRREQQRGLQGGDKRDMRHKTYEGTYMKQEQLALVRKEHVQKQTLEKSAAGYDSRLSYVTMAYERQK